MRILGGVVLVAAAFYLGACGGEPAPESGATPADNGGSSSVASETIVARWDHKTDGATWTAFAVEAVRAHGSALVASTPADVDAYCPSYRNAGASDRTAFWVGLMSALSKWESNYDPSVTFTESFDDSQGNPVISRGLLQISKESANGYGCGIGDDTELHDPKVNLSCAARIFNRLVVRDGVIATSASPWKGAAAYWSPFRRADRRADLQNWTAQQDYCS